MVFPGFSSPKFSSPKIPWHAFDYVKQGLRILGSSCLLSFSQISALDSGLSYTFFTRCLLSSRLDSESGDKMALKNLCCVAAAAAAFLLHGVMASPLGSGANQDQDFRRNVASRKLHGRFLHISGAYAVRRDGRYPEKKIQTPLHLPFPDLFTFASFAPAAYQR